MTDQTVYFYPSPGDQKNATPRNEVRIEPSTCTEAESFVLRVLDDSMEPEFRRGCLIVIDPTGRATDGSYVLSRQPDSNFPSRQAPSPQAPAEDEAIEGFLFRQLRKNEAGDWVLRPLNAQYQSEQQLVTLDAIVGVIVQRAGTRRRYHKRYD